MHSKSDTHEHVHFDPTGTTCRQLKLAYNLTAPQKADAECSCREREREREGEREREHNNTRSVAVIDNESYRHVIDKVICIMTQTPKSRYDQNQPCLADTNYTKTFSSVNL
jgi:hypothetical protein